jgi:hypothetical protein
VLVFVTGDGPGMGKSSLALAAARRLNEHGAKAAVFEERDILVRPEFTSVMSEFRSTGRVERATLLQAASSYGESCTAAGGSVYVLDALFPYLASLFAWGYSDGEIAEFLVELRDRLAAFELIGRHLAGDVAAGLERASSREGDEWLDGFVAKVSTYRDLPAAVATAADVTQYLQHTADRSRLLLAGAPWPTVFLDADRGLRAILDDACAAVLGVAPPHDEIRP